MELSGWLALAGLVFGSGAGVALVRYSVRHGEKHKEIELRLASGEKRFDRLEGKLGEIATKVDHVGVAVREVLVAIGERKPGAGINGETTGGRQAA